MKKIEKKKCISKMYRHRPRRTDRPDCFIAHVLTITITMDFAQLPNQLYPAIHQLPNPNRFPDQTIYSPTVERFLVRSIGMGWYHRVEDSEPNAEAGQRFLVNRHVATIRGQIIVQDYITTRSTDQNNIYQGWSHQTVAYLQGEISPYPHHFDRRHHHHNPINNSPLSSSALLSFQ